MIKTILLITFILGAIASIFIAAVAYDLSDLTHYSFHGELMDKWHEESCTPLMSAQGAYIGELCDDIFTIVLNSGGERIQTQIQSSQFKQLKIGSTVRYEYDRGKIGLTHNKIILPIN